MKKITAILLTIGILAQAFSKLIILAEFYANRDYIARNLCVNRDKPQSTCHGKCHLMKKLSKDEDQGNSSSGKSLKEKQEIQLFCGAISLAIPFQKYRTSIEKIIPVNDLTTASFSKPVFHPPAV